MNHLLKVTSLVLSLIMLFAFASEVKAYTIQGVANDPDINIELREWGSPKNLLDPTPGIISKYHFGSDAEIDPKAPQLDTVISGVKVPHFSNLFQLNQYEGPSSGQIPADGASNWGVTLAEFPNNGDVLVPESGYDLGGGYQAIVLYAENGKVTLNYTLGQGGTTGSPIEIGYTVHVLQMNIDPALQDLYNRAKSQNKYVALPCGYKIGTTGGHTLVSIRDSGTFMDPRSGYDWWQRENNPPLQTNPITCDPTLEPKIVSPGEAPGESVFKDSTRPIPDPYVPCNEVRPVPGSENEFHSLRPYQSSPCVQKVVETVGYCGNNFYAKETFDLLPENFGHCEGDTNGNLSCYDVPSITSAIQVDIDLLTSELPILGNTQLVPNTINTVNVLDNATRMNNYVSWYLNGAVYRPENAIPTLSEILAFAGPIRKLLPQVIQTVVRQDQIDQAGVTRHNQVVTPTGQRLEQANPDSNYTPLSGTEDRVGEITAENKYPEGGFGGDTFFVKDIVFDPGGTPEFPSNRDDIYFAHTQESSQLAKVLQSTFASIDNPSKSDEDDWNPDFKQIPARVRGFCDIKNYRTNPGDDLFGDYNNINNPDYPYKEKINGTFNYKTDVYHGPVHFSPVQKVDQACVEAGGTPDSCTYYTYEPQKRYAYMALYVYTKSPLIKEIWERLVDGTASVVGRFFPKEIKLNDTPAGVAATYNANPSSASVGDGVEAIAGSPYAPKSGDEALLFIPHLGAVKDYFLDGLQCALRPQGMCGNKELQQPTGVSAPNSCTIDGSGIVSKNLQAIIANASSWSHVPISVLTMVVKNEAACPDNAAEVSNFDPNSTTICEATDAQLASYLSATPITYPRNCNFAASDKTHSRGPLQFQPTEWETWKSALSKATGSSRTPNVCNIEDSIYAAAYQLSAGYEKCPQSGYDVGQTPATAWDLAHMKNSLSHWAAGCSKPVCDGSIAANNFYCGNVENFDSNISNSCK